MVFGRNYDWITATGVVNTNLRGQLKTSLPPKGEQNFQWISKYGSITFNQYGKEFPTGGMNEAGLVVELMWLDGSKYPKPDARPALSVLQWIQFQLDNCKSIEEVIATDKKVRVDGDDTPQHYLIADANGNVATIEFLDEKMVVHSGKDLPFPVLANGAYKQSAENIKAQIAEGKPSVNFQDNSMQRFATACNMVQKFHRVKTEQPIVEYAFDILNNVSQGSFTKWSIVYDISNKKIAFKTEGNKQVKTFSFSDFDFSCNGRPNQLNMNQDLIGDVSKKFSAYTNENNHTYLKMAFDASKPQINVSEESIKKMAEVAANVKCNNN